MDLARSFAHRFGQLSHPDAVPRPFVAICPAVILEEGERLPWHHHRKAQLLYTLRGIVHCETEDGIRIVPPQCAVWIPSDLPHSAFGSGDIECHCLFVEPDAAPGLPERCCTVSISPLLRELLRRAARLPELYDADGADGRLVAVILDELAAAPVENLHLPMPVDPRLRALAGMLLAGPANHASLQEWASRVALSERSLSRLLAQEVGMSFGRWRRQLHVMLALQRLAAGESVQAVAIDLGYESASSFVTMFRKAMGKPPGRYLQEQGRM
ncbi:AraC family transcriptional regulator [Plastoroseomonas hellenica]|uniref:AraC family transcriptional regulator n=1 Tax=Plastoroseomonas hellenica TaxID=2687306 RepID=UPI001BA58D8D|nr:helix-turn-helix transcriptional regulator [Plastoroseomonas hellenica]MBR0644611.1 AraC family transcriptional regulator [Plastoroseomonas hellenica]